MIPAFEDTGNLPPGIHWATWEEIVESFGTNEQRRNLLQGLKVAVDILHNAGCETVYIDGSFVTSKENPADFDCCWDLEGVSLELLEPALMDFSNKRAEQKARFRGELFPTFARTRS